MLEIRNLNAWYGESHILHGVDFDVREGEVVTLLGRNGAGKTTTMKSIMGLVPRREGSIKFKGQELVAMMPNHIARAGVAFCPEERGIFGSLTVTENLMLPPVIAEGGLSIDEIYSLFPNLKERARTAQGTRLSGGEQQMLAIARGLASNPKLLLIDELSLGLAPRILDMLFPVLERLNREGLAILLVEQLATQALAVSHRAYVMETGRITLSGRSAELANDPAVRQAYLGRHAG